nr:hypothetical protein CFP56_18469 [Quercus suber]
MTRESVNHAGYMVSTFLEHTRQDDSDCKEVKSIEIGSFDESARLIRYFSLFFLNGAYPKACRTCKRILLSDCIRACCSYCK